MPFMDGHQAAKILKSKMKNKLMKVIPIVANTANGVEVRKEMPAHFDDVIEKPIQRKVL